MKLTFANLTTCLVGGAVVALFALGFPAAPIQEGGVSWPTP